MLDSSCNDASRASRRGKRPSAQSAITGYQPGPAAELARAIWVSWCSSGLPAVNDPYAPEAWTTWRQRVWRLVRNDWDRSGRDPRPYACPPPGVDLCAEVTVTPCRRRTCVMCHARHVAEAYTTLTAIGPVSGYAAVTFRLDRFRPTSLRATLKGYQSLAARVWCRPRIRGKAVEWETLGVAVLPLGFKWPAITNRLPLARPADLFNACLMAFRYPADWVKAEPALLGRAEYLHVKGGRYWHTYGAARGAKPATAFIPPVQPPGPTVTGVVVVDPGAAAVQ